MIFTRALSAKPCMAAMKPTAVPICSGSTRDSIIDWIVGVVITMNEFNPIPGKQKYLNSSIEKIIFDNVNLNQKCQSPFFYS